MVQVPNNFQFSNEGAVASVDFYDFASRAGYKVFYPVVTQDSVSKKYALSTQVVDGDYNISYLTVNNTNTEINFDLTFTNPVIIMGEALINYSQLVGAGLAVHCKFTVYHVSVGGTETSLGTIDSNTLTAGGVTEYHRRLAKITLTARNIGVGEKLRLEVIYYSSGAGNSTIYFDPSSRQTFTETGTGATIGSDMVFMPQFKIDL